MHSSNLYATDGLLILGVVLVCVTVYTGLRGLYCRSSAAAFEHEDESTGDHTPTPVKGRSQAEKPKARRAA